ncbi:MAG: DNA cytosine methyltransferase, partial [Candidatus Fonsibacter sp.]
CAFLLDMVDCLVTQRRATFDHMLKLLPQIGNGAHKVGCTIVDTAQHGIPQHRERVYMVELLRIYLVPGRFNGRNRASANRCRKCSDGGGTTSE